ncbi:MAG: ribonuclease III [Lachnospiraceae bacterium]|nr:ribonuclease III [Lachnospiraceae bacterium]
MPEENILQQMKEKFQLGEQELNSYSPLVLAYMGDCVYELIVRTILVEQRNCPVRKLHKKATDYVKAKTQADLIMAVLEDLTEEEKDVYRRGRNAKSHTVPKNASLGDYRKATGMEAVIGYLYLKKDMERVLELVKRGWERTGLWGMQQDVEDDGEIGRCR